MTATRYCAEADLRPNLCEVTCRRKTVGRDECPRKSRILGANLADQAEVGDIVLGKDGGPMRVMKDTGLEAVVPPVPRVTFGFDGSRMDELIAATWENHRPILQLPAGANRFSAETHLGEYQRTMSEHVADLAALYVRPTFFNRPIGEDADGTPVWWSDLVDENIAAADVRITL